MNLVYISIGTITGVIILLYHIGFAWKTGVPYMGTPKKRFGVIFPYILRSVRKKPEDMVLMDLGSGTGKVLFAAEAYGVKNLIGYEISPLHVFLAKAKTKLKKSHIKTIWKSYLEANIADADVIYLFLNSSGLAQIEEKIFNEAKPGALIIAFSSAFQDKTPNDIIPTGDKGINIYAYIS